MQTFPCFFEAACDSQQIPGNHGETEDGKQHSFKKVAWEAPATERRLFVQVRARRFRKKVGRGAA